ncbi:Mal regulon transcriptional regulator MalI [Grimontia hollisae]|uniref:Maltose regulon regulatory protein MalI (Repressor for malXY) n=2 Tax=Grimontia hollisae TaxID=673 RepID=D0I9S6_GRIHO|nr:Mal regulon transcriptional regulator MalI [Grimontia hollisae]AMG28987.1 Mal regulon transcriptional regulator MalI [Grimontia hollisae]EEY71791.1 maltose regulon regulatory protein MalI (repressor for malXY) [Grimontia hollisae CIP 101886]MDF2184799.1 Mal regulon transcriptional regulator MalI [Grimontia hollisae]STO77117.1 Catabolite control protein [Grimontia hollisae]STO98301.1 Catabolite control protein [Grimontia hollisae]
MKKVTITDVAEHAGVSVTTVSMVLSNKGRISPDTAGKVNKAVAELGYVRNRAAANLRSHSSEILGLILKDISDPYYAQVAAGLCEETEKQGYMVFLAQSGNEDKFEQCMLTMARQGVGGIAFCPINENQQVNAEVLNTHDLPIVCISRASVNQQIDYVGPDNASAAKIATEHLIGQGHRRIAYVGGKSSSLCRAERVGGYCSTLMQFSLPFKPEWVVECEAGQAPAAKAVETLLAKHPQISAVLCHYSSTALGAIQGVHRVGRSVGNDSIFNKEIAIVGFDAVQDAELTAPLIPFVNSNAREIGRHAAKRLIEQVEKRDTTPRKIIVAPSFINHSVYTQAT